MPTPPILIPCLRYTNAPGAIDFLCNAFGFERQAVFVDEADPAVVHHAQLTLGESMVMLGSARPDETQARHRWRTPGEAGGVTMCVYAIVADLEAHYARARAAGAEIVTELQDNVGYPGRSYSARDPEGNDWSFGTYNPWAM